MTLPKEKIDVGSVSLASVSLCGGATLNLWSAGVATETEGEYMLALAPHQTAVIGRQEGGEIEYLDPAFQPTQMLPGAEQPIVACARQGADTFVSRGHFMLKGDVDGILLVNGVPRRGGGIRTPLNGTRMIAPQDRTMTEAEEWLIPRGDSVRLRLPNHLIVCIAAN